MPSVLVEHGTTAESALRNFSLLRFEGDCLWKAG
jgi:hypothetical protein